MGADGPSLLRLLAGGVRPVGSPDPQAPPGRTTLDFPGLLDRAAAGSVRSDLPVRIPPAIRGSVDEAIHARLSDAADAAAAEGVDRALVMLGERMFRLDVDARAIIDAPDAQEKVITGIDGVVIRDAGGPSEEPRPSSGPARVVRNASLIHTLAREGREST
ncbi:MAG: hypothetical protein LAT64_07155 [Phycisphaerales bacterium]|nr:hypothetical protein [Planctomycetota bacterium]MCH8508533.1 hypothetical protein [Phycisphaerales bacterium]